MAARVMAELHEAVGELLASAGDPIARAVDVERVLGLDKTLAWQVFRLGQSPDLAEAANVPSRTSARRLLEAARRRRVPKRVLDRVGLAFEEFENLAALHGGDRAGLMSMMSGFLGTKSQQYDLKVRKSVFRGQAHLWGVHARKMVHTAVFMPRRIADGQVVCDLAHVAADIGLAHRFQGEPLITHRWLWTHEEPTGGPASPGAPANDGPVILPQFSTQPLPRMHTDGTLYGSPQTELVFPPGLPNAVTLYSLQRRENFPTPVEQGFFFQTIFRVPTEALVWEILVPAGWSLPATAHAAIYGCRTRPDRVYEERTADLMPQRETLDYLGVHESVPPLAGEPAHAAAVRHAIESCGWLGTRFDVYRCVVEYPLLFTMLVTRVGAARTQPAAG